MRKNNELKKHFQEHYSQNGSFGDNVSPCALTCVHQSRKECKVNSKSEASFSGSIGDRKSNVMVIGESPSTGWTLGAHFAGRTRNLKKYSSKHRGEKDALINFLDHFKLRFGFYPYYTDWVKCGPKLTKQKEVLKHRKKFCEPLHLKNEILILKPQKIYCLGLDCYTSVLRFVKKEFKGIVPQENVIQLTHFGLRAALPLPDPEDKKIIWDLELGKIKSKVLAGKKILKLSKIKEKLEKSR